MWEMNGPDPPLHPAPQKVKRKNKKNKREKKQKVVCSEFCSRCKRQNFNSASAGLCFKKLPSACVASSLVVHIFSWQCICWHCKFQKSVCDQPLAGVYHSSAPKRNFCDCCSRLCKICWERRGAAGTEVKWDEKLPASLPTDDRRVSGDSCGIFLLHPTPLVQLLFCS